MWILFWIVSTSYGLEIPGTPQEFYNKEDCQRAIVALRQSFPEVSAVCVYRGG